MSRQSPRWLPTTLAVVIVFVGGLVIGSQLAGSTAAHPPSDGMAGPAATAQEERPAFSTTPTTVAAPTRQTAVQAAAAFTTAFDGDILLDPRRREELLDEYAAEESREDLSRVFRDIARLIQAELHLTADDLDDPGFVWRSVPAGARIDAFSSHRATVSIWGTGVVIARGVPLAQPGWRTTEVELVWERDAWRLVTFRSKPGPEPPAVGGTPDASLRGRLINQFRPLRDLSPSWPDTSP